MIMQLFISFFRTVLRLFFALTNYPIWNTCIFPVSDVTKMKLLSGEKVIVFKCDEKKPL